MERHYQFSPREFYEELVKAQRYVMSEDSMYRYEQGINRTKVKDFGLLMQTILSESKISTVSLYNFFEELITGKKTRIPNYYSKYAKKQNNKENTYEKMISNDEFLLKCSNIDIGSPAIRLLSLNTIPSYFSFLFTHESKENYLRFITSFVNDPIRFCEFSRFLFTNPHSIKFINEVIKPVFTKISNVKALEKDPKFIVGKVYENWKEHMNILPSYIKDTMEVFYQNAENEQGSFIFNSFFVHLIKCPQIYCAVHPYQVYLAPDLFDPLLDEFKARSKDFELLILNESKFNVEFTPEMCSLYKDVFNCRVFDSLDCKLLKVLQDAPLDKLNDQLKKINFDDEKNYEIKIISDQNLENFDCTLEQTTVLTNKTQQNLRALLKISFPLNFPLQYPEKQDMTDFIYNNLVLKGPIHELPTRIAFFNEIIDDYSVPNNAYGCIPTTLIEMKQFFKEMKRNHDNEDRFMVNQTKAVKIINNFSLTIKSYCNDQTQAFYAYLLYHYAGFDPAPSMQDIIQNPEKFKDELNKRFHLVSEGELSFITDRKLVYHLLAENFTYHSYISLRHDLEIIDQIVHNYINRNKEQMMRSVDFGNKMKNDKFMDNIDAFNEALQKFKTVFEDSNDILDAFQKYAIASDLITRAAIYIYQKRDIGAEEQTSISMMLLLLANPINPFSMLIFIHEIAQVRNIILGYDNALDFHFACINFLLGGIQIVGNFDFDMNYLTLTNRIKINIAICGENNGLKKRFVEEITQVKDSSYNNKIFQTKLPSDVNRNYILCPTFYSFEAPEEMKNEEIEFDFIIVFPCSDAHLKNYIAVSKNILAFIINRDDSIFGRRKPDNVIIKQNIQDNERREYYSDLIIEFYTKIRQE